MAEKTTYKQQAAGDAARSFRLAMRLRESDPLAHSLALHQHFDRFVPPPAQARTCAVGGR